jgi:hypothetical protein
MSSSASPKSNQWPKYESGRAEYNNALGVLAANFNYLETWLRYLFSIYVQIPDQARAFVFTKFDNQARIDFLRFCVDGASHPPRVKKSLEYFFTCFDRCATNRNLLLHAQVVPVVNLRS